VLDVTLTDNIQHQSQPVDTDNITRVDQRENNNVQKSMIKIICLCIPIEM